MATGTLGNSARDYHTRQTTFLSQQINTTNFGVAANLKIGTIPAGSVIVRATMATSVVFNGTTPVIAIGTASGGAQLFAAAAAGMATLGRTDITLIGTACGPLAADTDVWINNGTTGSVTTGAGVVIVEYDTPNPT